MKSRSPWTLLGLPFACGITGPRGGLSQPVPAVMRLFPGPPPPAPQERGR